MPSSLCACDDSDDEGWVTGAAHNNNGKANKRTCMIREEWDPRKGKRWENIPVEQDTVDKAERRTAGMWDNKVPPSCHALFGEARSTPATTMFEGGPLHGCWGDWAKRKSKEDKSPRNRGLTEPSDLLPSCGRRYHFLLLVVRLAMVAVWRG